MAKKSEIIGEYIVEIADNDSVSVSRKSTIEALREIADANGIEYQEKVTTQRLGRIILDSLCNKEQTDEIGEYTIKREENGHIDLKYSNTYATLEKIAKEIGFPENPREKGWNTQYFGRQLVIYAQELKDKK